jgi:hypothetical protein
MYTQLSALVADERRRQLVAEASNERLARQARATAKPRVRRQRRFGAAWLKPVFDANAVRPAYQA